MPNYHYQCNDVNCQHEFKINHSIKDDILKKCPKCNNLTLCTVFYPAHAFVKEEPKTLGLLAERNSQSLGNQGMQEIWAKTEERKQLAKETAYKELTARLPEGAIIPIEKKSEAWYRPDTNGPITDLANLTPEKTRKFIEEGKI